MAEYLSEEEQLEQLKGWWNRYGWWLLAALVIGLGGYFLMQYLDAQKAEQSAAASAAFQAYQEAGSDGERAGPLAQLDGEFVGTPYHIMSLLSRAQAAADAEDIDGAIGFYQSAADGPEVEHLSDVARLRLARSLQQSGRSDDAFAALGSVAGEGYRSLVAELKGDILQAQGKSAQAREAYLAAVDAQGENPQTYLKMKLANIVATATDGPAADAGREPESQSENQSENQVTPQESDTAEAVVSDTVNEISSETGSEVLQSELTETETLTTQTITAKTVETIGDSLEVEDVADMLDSSEQAVIVETENN